MDFLLDFFNNLYLQVVFLLEFDLFFYSKTN